MTSTDQEIGIATLMYNSDGVFSEANFKPTMMVSVNDKMMTELIDAVDCNSHDDIISNQANGVFAAWFQRMNEIELADRSQFEIAAELIEPCERWDNGVVKLCKIRFMFKHL